MPNPDVDSPTGSPFVNLNHQTSSSSKRKPGVGVVIFDSPPRRRVSVNSHGPRRGSTLAIEWVGDGDDNHNDTVGVNVPDDDDNTGNGSGTIHLNAQSLYPLFNVGEHDISLSIFQTDFLFRASDILDFFPFVCDLYQWCLPCIITIHFFLSHQTVYSSKLNNRVTPSWPATLAPTLPSFTLSSPNMLPPLPPSLPRPPNPKLLPPPNVPGQKQRSLPVVTNL